MKLNKNGFTLVELLVTVVIIAGFAAMIYPSYVSSIERARASEAVNMLATIQAVQSKHFIHYEEYGTTFRDINDFTPSINNFDASQNNFFTDYFHYTLGNNLVTADRVDSDHNALDKGYNLTAHYNESFVRCYVIDGDEDGEKVCSSLTDEDERADANGRRYYRVY